MKPMCLLRDINLSQRIGGKFSRLSCTSKGLNSSIFLEKSCHKIYIMPAEKDEVQTESESIEAQIKIKTVDEVKQADKAQECCEERLEGTDEIQERTETTKEENGTNHEHDVENVNQNAAKCNGSDLISQTEQALQELGGDAVTEKQINVEEQEFDTKSDQCAWEGTEDKSKNECENLSESDKQTFDVEETDTKSEESNLDEDIEEKAATETHTVESVKRSLEEDGDVSHEDASLTKKAKNSEEFDESIGDTEK